MDIIDVKFPTKMCYNFHIDYFHVTQKHEKLILTSISCEYNHTISIKKFQQRSLPW